MMTIAAQSSSLREEELSPKLQRLQWENSKTTREVDEARNSIPSLRTETDGLRTRLKEQVSTTDLSAYTPLYQHNSKMQQVVLNLRATLDQKDIACREAIERKDSEHRKSMDALNGQIAELQGMLSDALNNGEFTMQDAADWNDADVDDSVAGDADCTNAVDENAILVARLAQECGIEMPLGSTTRAPPRATMATTAPPARSASRPRAERADNRESATGNAEVGQPTAVNFTKPGGETNARPEQDTVASVTQAVVNAKAYEKITVP